MKQRLLLAQSLLGNRKLFYWTNRLPQLQWACCHQKSYQKIGENKNCSDYNPIFFPNTKTIANNIVLLNKGQVVFDGTREKALTKYGKNNLEEVYVEVFGVEECIDYS